MFYVLELLHVPLHSGRQLQSLGNQLSPLGISEFELVLPHFRVGLAADLFLGTEIEGQGWNLVDLPTGLVEVQDALLQDTRLVYLLVHLVVLHQVQFALGIQEHRQLLQKLLVRELVEHPYHRQFVQNPG